MSLHRPRALPEIPPRVRTREGFEFDPRPSVWRVASPGYEARNWRFDEFASAGPRFVVCLKLGLIHFLENRSFDHSANLFGRFLDFYRSTFSEAPPEGGLVDLDHLLRFRASLSPDTVWYLGVVRILLVRLQEARLSIATQAAIDHLRRSRIPGNPKGVDVRTRDPKRGAFSTPELEAIQSQVNKAYAEGAISLSDYALAVVFLAFAPRPAQAMALKERDLVVGTDRKEQKVYVLLMPRAKQRGAAPRQAQPKSRRCAQNVGKLLESLVEHNAKLRQDRGVILDDPPLFMGAAEGEFPDFAWHETRPAIGRRLIRTLAVACPDLPSNPKRFRHTLAQRLADMGASKHVVAEILDHSDTQNVGVYFEASTASAARLSRKMALDLAPLAQAFKGMRVAPAREVSGGHMQGGGIHDWSLPGHGGDALGSCGQMGFCGLNVPVACYTCRHFQPILEGPHDEELEKLLAERERQRLAGYDNKIVEILDSTILAVAEVIRDCETMRTAMGVAAE